MRIAVRHSTTYSYETPARSVIQTLRLTPRDFDGQHVIDWRIDIDADCRLVRGEDSFGNITHSFSIGGSIGKLAVTVEGEIETFDTSGIVRDAIERFPPELYLRETPLTQADAMMGAFAQEIAGPYDGEGRDLARLHALLGALHSSMTFDTDPTHAGTTAAEAFALRKGVCQDFAHVFIACARELGIPARYISGHFLRTDGKGEQEAGHAWAEAYVKGLGWVGFDPAHGLCPHESHIRVACGLDYLSAAPVRGTQNGGQGEALAVSVSVMAAGGRPQGQSQSQT